MEGPAAGGLPSGNGGGPGTPERRWRKGMACRISQGVKW